MAGRAKARPLLEVARGPRPAPVLSPAEAVRRAAIGRLSAAPRLPGVAPLPEPLLGPGGAPHAEICRAPAACWRQGLALFCLGEAPRSAAVH